MIKIRNLHKAYSSVVFDELNIDITAHITYIKGGNGTGKTTLLNIICGLDSDYQGQVVLDQISSVAYVSQVSNLLPKLTFKQNLELFTDDYDLDKLSYLLKIFDLADKYKSRSKISKFSGGEQKKVQLVVSLLQNYDVLILDEVDNHLDEQSIYKLIEYIKCEPQMVIIVSHSLEDYLDTNDYDTLDLNCPPITTDTITELDQFSMSLSLTTAKLNILNKLNENIMILICVCMLVIALAFSYLTFGSMQSIVWEFNQVSSLELDFKNNSSLVYPPAFSDYFFEFGDSSQLETTKLYFTQDDLNRLKSLSSVEKVIPITEKNASVASNAYEQDGVLYTMLNTPLGVDPREYTFNQLRLPNEIMNNIPSVYYINGHKLLSGSIPEDNTNQILVDTNLADQLMSDLNISSYEQLISETVTIPVENYSSKEETELNFVISGIIDTLQYNEVFVASNSSSEYYQNDVEYWDDMTAADVNAKLGDVVEYVLNGDYSIYEDYYNPSQTYYMGFYVELKDEQDEQQFTTTIDDYDHYIEVLNNYTTSHTPIFKYLRTTIVKNILIIIGGLCILICLEGLLFKYLLNDMEKTNDSLTFYKFNSAEVDKFNQVTRKKLNLNIFIGLLLAYIITIYYSFQSVPSIIISIFFIAIYGVGFILIRLINKLILKKEKK